MAFPVLPLSVASPMILRPPTSAPLELDHVSPVAPVIEPPPPRSDAPLKVLLLDDQEDFRDVIRDYLVSRLYRVTEVSNGAEGLRAIMRETYDLIICDMMMPKVGGEMFYWAVTRVRPAARLRFVFITGHQNDPKVDHFFRRVQATVLIKPFKLEDLNASLLDIDRKLR